MLKDFIDRMFKTVLFVRPRKGCECHSSVRPLSQHVLGDHPTQVTLFLNVVNPTARDLMIQVCIMAWSSLAQSTTQIQSKQHCMMVLQLFLSCFCEQASKNKRNFPIQLPSCLSLPFSSFLFLILFSCTATAFSPCSLAVQCASLRLQRCRHSYPRAYSQKEHGLAASSTACHL